MSLRPRVGGRGSADEKDNKTYVVIEAIGLRNLQVAVSAGGFDAEEHGESA